jgi:RHS repeat-associated protein
MVVALLLGFAGRVEGQVDVYPTTINVTADPDSVVVVWVGIGNSYPRDQEFSISRVDPSGDTWVWSDVIGWETWEDMSRQVPLEVKRSSSGSVQFKVQTVASVKTITVNVTMRDRSLAGVTVTPAVTSVTGVKPGATDSLKFTVKNGSTGTGARKFELEADCGSGPAANCLVSPASVSLTGGASATVWLKYTGNTPGGSGPAQLKVLGTGSETGYHSEGTVSLSVQNLLAVEVDGMNPGATVERSFCLAVAAGAGAGYECGDLRLVHGLPVTQAMNVDRSPVLLYNNQQASPVPVVAADVWLPTGVSQTDSVTATLKVKAATAATWVTRATGVWTASGWAGQARRIALGFDAAADVTGLYDYTLEVKQGSSTITRTGRLVIVNRSASPFGAGWWVGGIGQLVQTGTSFLWVGGDGSTRLYEPATSTNPTKWIAKHPDMAGVDSIRKITSGTQTVYVHDMADKTKVYFSATGLQDSTVSRTGHSTRFQYDTYGRLLTILLPAPTGVTRQQYAISWPAAGAVGNYTITAPPQVGATTVSRVTKVALTALTGGGGRIRYIQDPDSPSDTLLSTRFSYPNTTSRLVSSRTDKLGTRNSYSYTPVGNRFATLVADTGTSRLNIRSDFSPVEVLGLKVGTAAAARMTPVTLTSAMTMVLGPIQSSTVPRDTTRIWTDRWGAPTTIRNAIGQETKLFRNDARFPALVTEVRAPGGFTTRAAFNTRGAPVWTMEVNPYGDNRDAVTSYEYADSLRHSFLPTKVTQPEGEYVRLAYDSVGNTLWVEDGRGSTSRVNFTYMQGACAGLPERVIEPAALPATSSPDTLSYAYDTRCNLKDQITPLKIKTTRFRNSIGQIDSIYLPIDASRREVQRFSYDAMDRVITTTRIGPDMGLSLSFDTVTYTGAETLVVQTRYDRNGNPVSVRADGTQRDSTEYDRLGRVTRSLTYDPHYWNTKYADSIYKGVSTSYDAAGNPISVKYGDAPAVTMTYDRLNRLTQRVVPPVSFPGTTWIYAWYAPPEETEVQFPVYPNSGSGLVIPNEISTFQYHPVTGLMTLASTGTTRIVREYYPNGALRRDSLRVWYKNDPPSDDVLEYEYDRDGRRTLLRHLLAPQGGTQHYEYHPQTGALSGIVDRKGNRYTFEYDLQNELRSLAYPNGIKETYGYDKDGRPVTRTATGGATGVAARLAFTNSYDQRSKMLSTLTDASIYSGGMFRYSGLGYLMSSGTYGTSEEMLLAPDGYIMASRSGLADDPTTMTYSGPGGRNGTTNPRTCSTFDECSVDPYVDWATLSTPTDRRDAAGNEVDVVVESSFHDRRDQSQTVGRIQQTARTMNWYSADQKLRFTQRMDYRDWGTKQYTCYGTYKCDQYLPFEEDGEFVEYIYDALGRRVYTDIRRDTTFCNTVCTSPKEYSVWDGDQLLQERRTTAAAYGRPANWITVTYTHGLGIDQPLSMIRSEAGDSTFSIGINPLTHLPQVVTVFRSGTPQLIIPHRDSRGVTFMATNSQGQLCCAGAYFPGDSRLTAFLREMSLPIGSIRGHTWYGSLAASSMDQNGLVYRRNRYYNPESGQFTQMDPIGIAGGLNVYGYAGGDPINYGDPFGLSPCKNSVGEEVPCPDMEAVVEHMRRNALETSDSRCATFCRLGLEAGGFDSRGHPISAGDYGPFLLSRGAEGIPLETYLPQMGDIVVFGKNTDHKDGHIAIFDGQIWISDYRQRNMNPYKDQASAGPTSIYRFPQQ